MSNNEGVMTESMIEDMNIDDGHDAKKLLDFQTRFNSRVGNWKKKNPGREPSDKDWYKFTRGAFMATFFWDIAAPALAIGLAESIGVFYTWYIGQLVLFLLDPNGEIKEGLGMVAIFSLSVLIRTLGSNFFFYLGFRFSLDLRKVLVSAMYDKISRLSVRSITETNSGKLITLISADIFALEKNLAISP